ncbi:MAG TPA: SDR family oxidoreductase [Solirubrobacteraceae bacterium]
MTTIVIAGGHGKIALRLARLLSARGDSVRALIRNPGHQAGVRATGAEPVLADMEALDSLAEFVEGADGVVFAAGAGPGSGPARKRTVDFGAAVKLLDAARATGARRYLMISAMGAADPASGSEAMRPYLEAKADADAALAASDLDWTIVRPGGLTDDPGTGMVRVGESLDRGTVTRDDVAAVLAGCLDEPRTVHKAFDLLQGDTPVAEALAAL